MDILGKLKAKGLEQLNVEGKTGQPFVPTDHMGGAHQVVIHRVSKVIGGNTVGFQQYVIYVVLGNGQLSLHQVIKLKLVFDAAGGTKAKDPGLSGRQLCLNVCHGTVTPNGVGSIIAGGFFLCLLLLPDGVQFLLRAEARVGHPLRNQLLGVDVINPGPLALTVRTVNAVVTIDGCPFIETDIIMLQRVDEYLHGAGDLPLGVGVLHPEKQHASGLVSHPFGNHALHQIAQMHKAGRGRRHPGDHSSFRQVPLGKPCFHFLRSLGHIGKQKVR